MIIRLDLILHKMVKSKENVVEENHGGNKTLNDGSQEGKLNLKNVGRRKSILKTDNDFKNLKEGQAPRKSINIIIKDSDNVIGSVEEDANNSGESLPTDRDSLRPARGSLGTDLDSLRPGMDLTGFEKQSTFYDKEALYNRLKHGRKCCYRCRQSLFNILVTFVKYLRRMFTIPWTREPISFTRPENIDDKIKSSEYDDPINEAELEVLCNYDIATREIFEFILRDRKEAQTVKDTYQFLKVDMSKYPEWTDSLVDRLRSTFQVFDVSGDGLVDFEELSSILAEFGDTSTLELKQKYFNIAIANSEDTDAIDFIQFMDMIYSLTMVNKDPSEQALADSFRLIDRNMSRIRNLDVVQQLQAGLF